MRQPVRMNDEKLRRDLVDSALGFGSPTNAKDVELAEILEMVVRRILARAKDGAKELSSRSASLRYPT